MTGTTILTSAPTNISYKDNIFYELVWTGSPVGTFQVQVSADYNPGTPQSDGAYDNGTWTEIPVTDQSGNAPAAQGQDGQVVFDLSQISAPWVRVVYTNASGTGTLNGWVAGKSTGL